MLLENDFNNEKGWTLNSFHFRTIWKKFIKNLEWNDFSEIESFAWKFYEIIMGIFYGSLKPK
jgi:hypothetical protein